MEHASLIPTVSGPDQSGLLYFCTTRIGGSSSGERASLNLGTNTGDDPLQVQTNRQRLRDVLGAEPVWLQQVHGTDVLDADQDVLPDEPRLFDAAVTTRSDRVLAILTADCLPVVVWDGRASVVGVAHAGWRGLQAGVLARMMALIKQRRPQAQQWRAWIGPAISQPCFEVGQEVFDAFVQADPANRPFFIAGQQAGKWQADLSGMAARQLELLCPGDIQVYFSQLCTYTESERFYSYRRSPQTGRQATIARLTSP